MKKRYRNSNIIRQYGIAVFVLITIAMLASCEKEVHVNLSSGPPSIVIQGAIESDLPPYVVLTRSVGYLSKIDLSTLENTFVHGAKVKVSDGSQEITLREYSIDTGTSGNKFSFYSIDTADQASFYFRGKTDYYYTLKVEVDGKTYTSVTKVPNVEPLDNIWVDTVTAPPDKIPGARLLYFKYTDPDTPGNCVRYFTRRNSEPFYPGIGSVYNDEIVNGSSISTNFLAGYDRSKEPNRDSLGFFYLGDTVTIKWCAIDKGVYNFWNTFEFATGTVGNPFASPINVQTNIKGGALGIWAGYGAVQRSIIVSK